MISLRDTNYSYQPLQSILTGETEEDGDDSSLHYRLPLQSPSFKNGLFDKLNRRKFQALFFLTFFILVLYLILCVKLEDNDLALLASEETTPKYSRSSWADNDKTPKPKLACQIPKLDPFDKKIRHLIKEPEDIKCTEKFPLLFESTFNSTLVTARDVEEVYENVRSCCYQSLIRGDYQENPDDSYGLSKMCFPLPLKKSSITVIPPDHDFLVILCKFLNSTVTNSSLPSSTEVSSTTVTSSTNDKPNGNDDDNKNDGSYSKVMDMHALVHMKPEVEMKMKNYYDGEFSRITNGSNEDNSSNTSLERDKVNVVILGIDGVSRMNFIRTMPKSYKFLKDFLSAIEMEGFNKIGDNTFPNMAAALTSLNQSTVESTCEENKAFDKCPFIWKKYAGQGYRTSYGEDSTWMGIFNYLKIGFKSPPTDYYLRPFGVAAEVLIGSQKKYNARLCYGPRLSFEVLLDYARKMAHGMGHDKRYFQFIWATSLTHDMLNYGWMGDRHLLSTLKWFRDEGHLNQTVLVLMSDHGIRWGEIHNFAQGQLEERLPFLYYVTPTWFRNKYKRAYENLKLNQNRLTTPFDLHETLADLLNLNHLEEGPIAEKERALNLLERGRKLPRGISQFLPIPPSRTCEDAEIAEHYCTCHKLKETDKGKPEVKEAANFVVGQINEMVSSSPNCSTLSLVNIRTAHVVNWRLEEGASNSKKGNHGKGYELVVETSPGNAVFEASVIKSESGDDWKLSGTISRTNLYGNQSHCVNETELKLYCYCDDDDK